MIRRLNITGKIWLSIGIFITGYFLSTTLGLVQGLSTENKLHNAADALFPAAQASDEAESAFQRTVKGLSDSVMVQDASALDLAAEQGRDVVKGLNALAAIQGVSAQRSAQAKQLAASVQQFLTNARETYGAVLANPGNLTSGIRERMRALADQTTVLKKGLKKENEDLSQDLRKQLAQVQTRSAEQRWLALLLFFGTVIVAGVIVNLTIRRSITGPIVRVIHGVKKAVEGAAEASAQMTESGETVARDAQDQAAYIEETSSSLEEISATTRENANRATEADRLMQDGRRTVERATQAMNDLQSSMSVISKSSKQVADVLKSIDEIAFHTNILALNAAVEAARAGEAGAGFSVVADEVRSLAQRAADAARRSGDIIEKTIADVGTGVRLVAVAHTAFTEVSGTIASGSQIVSQIAASSGEQARGVAHIGEAISRMEKVTQNNAANARRTAEAATSVNTQSESTRRHIEELVAVVGLTSD